MSDIFQRMSKTNPETKPVAPPDFAVVALADHWRETAAALAETLQLPLGKAAYQLQLGDDGLSFVEAESVTGPLRVDFLAGAVAHRRQFGGGSGQMLAKAVGIRPGIRPTILDATAGMGRDAFVLAQLGCSLKLIERHPLIAALLADGLQRAQADAEVAPIIARMQLRGGDAITLMRDWHDELPQVIYLDPMFPHRDKSALVKKEMRLFRVLAGDDDDAPALLEAAWQLASHRVVVKRPRKAPAIVGPSPAYVLEGKSSRFDIYTKKALQRVINAGGSSHTGV